MQQRSVASFILFRTVLQIKSADRIINEISNQSPISTSASRIGWTYLPFRIGSFSRKVDAFGTVYFSLLQTAYY